MWETMLYDRMSRYLEGDQTVSSVQQLNYSGLHEIGKNFCEDNILVQRLYLKGNRLKTLPKEIALLINLVEIHLPGNEIKELPKEIGCLENLKYLDAGSNFLTHIPKTVGNLKKLQKLKLSINKINFLPQELKNLHSLETFEAAHNNLHTFPTQLCQCQKLKTLCLDSNFLTWVPRQIVKLVNLETLSLSGNNLLCLPYTLSEMANLQCFIVYVDNNPLLSVFIYGCRYGNYRCGTKQDFDDMNLQGFHLLDCYVNGKYRRLCIGRDVKIIGQPSSNNIPSLLELCLRTVSPYVSERFFKLPLPRELIDVLETESGVCFQCEKKFFTFAFPLIIKSSTLTDENQLYELIFCCSQNCLFLCAGANNFKMDMIFPV